MPDHDASAPPPRLTSDELNLLTLDIVQKLMKVYEPGRDRVVTQDNVYQPAIAAGRDDLEEFQGRLLLPGSRVEGLQHLDTCLEHLAQGRTVLLLADHRGNLDVPSFHTLLRREGSKYEPILERLTYIAGRKLNESSDFIKMFTEKYARLVIVPKRDFPKRLPDETPEQAAACETFEQEAARINRAAFRNLVRLKKAGHIFVLFPLGGRWKPDQDNLPVAETTSYIRSFDLVFLLSMEGNTLPVRERMEDERPVQERVVFRVGALLQSKPFLAAQRVRYDALHAQRDPEADVEFERYLVNQVMRMLASLRTTGDYGDSAAPAR